MSVRHKRCSFIIICFSSETCSFQSRMMSYLYRCVLQSLVSHFTLWDSSTSQSSRDFTLHVNLLRKARLLRLVAHSSRSCCVKGLHGFSCQPWNNPVLMISSPMLVGLLLILQTCKLAAHMAANQGCIVSASIWDKFFLSENLDLSWHLTI